MSLLTAAVRLLTNTRALDVAVVDGNGDQLTGFNASRPANATLATVATSTTTAVLQASNAARAQLLIVNDSNKPLLVAFAATATTTDYSVLIPGNGQWESVLNGYTGDVAAILESGTGSARVTEVTY